MCVCVCVCVVVCVCVGFVCDIHRSVPVGRCVCVCVCLFACICLNTILYHTPEGVRGRPPHTADAVRSHTDMRARTHAPQVVHTTGCGYGALMYSREDAQDECKPARKIKVY